MAPRTIFANLQDGLQPFSLWDQSLADMGSLGVTPCTATGTNAIVLTPAIAAQAPVPAYANNNQFSFVATATSTGSVTANVNNLGALNVYKSGGTVAGAGDIVSGEFYELAYNAGGFFLRSSSALTHVAASTSRGGTAMTYVPPSPNKYHLYLPTTVDYNQGGLWNPGIGPGSAFAPPGGAHLIHLVAQIWATSGVAASGNFVAKWIKNATIDGSFNIITGTDVRAGVGAISCLGSGSAIMRADCYDAPSPGDYYNLFMFIDSTVLGSTTVTID